MTDRELLDDLLNGCVMAKGQVKRSDNTAILEEIIEIIRIRLSQSEPKPIGEIYGWHGNSQALCRWFVQEKYIPVGTKLYAVSQPEPEPVAWMHNFIDDVFTKNLPYDIARHSDKWTPLYTAPPKKEWVGLTDEEIMQGKLHSRYAILTLKAWSDGVAWCEANLKEKNT